MIWIISKGLHEAIVSEEIWNKVNQYANKRSKQPTWNYRGENLLTGLLKCPECGSPMAASNTTGTLKDGTKKCIRYYSCVNY